MTRFVYIADTHWYADPMGYQQQPGFPEKLPEIYRVLDRKLSEWGVDLLVHGGDLVDAGTEENIVRAAKDTLLSAPAVLCLGNHDLTEQSSLAYWLRHAPRFFPGGEPVFTVDTPDCAIHVVPNHWCEQPYYWDRYLEPAFSADQIARIRDRVAARPYACHVLVTHTPALPVPVEQTGFDDPYHCPPEPARTQLEELIGDLPSIRCVLGAHSHINTCGRIGETPCVTVSSLAEVPFECKVFEIDPDGIRMVTRPLAGELDLGTVYNFDRTYVQGRPADRGFELTLGAK